MRHFDQGWRDRLRDVPPRVTYERRRTLAQVQYERGRHAASLWLVEKGMLNHKGDSHKGTIYKHCLRWLRNVDYAEVFAMASPELQAALAAEAAFCSLKSELRDI